MFLMRWGDAIITLSRRSEHYRWFRYGVPLASLAIVHGVRQFLNPWLGTETPFVVLYFLPVVIGAWLGGMGPAFLAAICGILIGDKVTLDPNTPWPARGARVSVFLLMTWLNAYLFQRQKRTQQVISRMNEELEARVALRTSQLAQVNQELEAFSYSVAHDLRAPLRAINGFAMALAEESRDQLDEQGKRYLDKVAKNATRMGQLIDDLLLFSRLGRKELQKTQLDMERLAKSVVEELKEFSLAGGEIKVYPLPSALGDRTLIYQALMNLISNALKFSRNKPKPLVEVGALSKGSETVYFVKDNGVGFEMEYVDKLFRVFQRLHANEEFEGTGVGLAIVQRIIHKHGGEIWAEAKVGEGAIFYFTLSALHHEKNSLLHRRQAGKIVGKS